MKLFKYTFLLMAAVILLSSCEFDNYEKPSSQFSGRLVYNGEPLGLSVGEVSFQLYEPGWQLVKPINVIVNSDGSFSALLFDASYKLIIPANQGPFVNKSSNGSDTIQVRLSGNTNQDIEVTPYYMIRNPEFTVSGKTVSATFAADQIITDSNAKGIERVNLYLNNTSLVDNRSDYNINLVINDKLDGELAGTNIADKANISLSATAPATTPSQNYVFARVGVKIAGVEKMIFSPVQKISL